MPDPAPIGTAVNISSLHHRFGNGVTAIEKVDLYVPAGQFIAILGPSGCGKSTLLRCVAGLQKPTSGAIEMDGPARAGNVTGVWSAPIAYVFQDAHLLPWRNVLRNVALPLELAGVPRDRRMAAATEATEAVGLGEFARAYPAQLSGGMRMRVSLARAMVTRPGLLLLDEPFAALDEITRQRLDQQLRQIWLNRRMTVLFVTHSTAEAVFLAERAAVLSSRPATIVADHAIELPTARDSLIRATPAFAEQTRFVYGALENEGAAR
ncbi:MAG TPA: ABC transporter ATP-binding protein [Tepidisphaeraceae bacterium]|nr:ABC transporter ATP-binding protein [Tepidisphaeraceae bacterium]